MRAGCHHRADNSWEPALRAEYAEEKRLHHIRLREWPEEKLRREGFMLDGLGGSVGWQPKGEGKGCVVTFRRGEGTTSLPYHHFV